MKFVKRVSSLPRLAQLSLRAISIAFASAFGIWLSDNYSKQYAADPITEQAIYWTSWIVIIAMVVLISFFVEIVSEQNLKEEQRRRAVYAFAYERIDRWISASLRAERQTPIADSASGRAAEKLNALIRSAELLIQGLYEVLESQYGGRSAEGDRIDFEVTFMTESYRDGGITLAAWANRAHRAPRSLTHLRPKDRDFYKDTVTAEVYRMPRPRPVMVSDTTITPSYKEIYPDQKGNIKSTIVFPVLDDASGLVGTIVCHCDMPNFFRPSEQKFWFGLIDVFSRRMALTKRRMDTARNDLEPDVAPPF